MRKHILGIILSAACLAGGVMPAVAGPDVEIVENDLQAVSIRLTGNELRITGAAGEMMQIYNVAGVRVMTVKIDSSDKTYNLNLPKGCYIVKVGKIVRKISIG